MSHAFADITTCPAAELNALGARIVATSCEVRAMRDLPKDVRAWLVLHLALVAQRLHAAADACPTVTRCGSAPELDLEPFRLVPPTALQPARETERRVA